MRLLPEFGIIRDFTLSAVPVAFVFGACAAAVGLGADIVSLDNLAAAAVAGVLSLSTVLWEGYAGEAVRGYVKRRTALLARTEAAIVRAEELQDASPVRVEPLRELLADGRMHLAYVEFEVWLLGWFPFTCAGAVVFLGTLKLADWAQGLVLAGLLWLTSYLTRAVNTSKDLAADHDKLEADEIQMAEIESRLALTGS